MVSVGGDSCARWNAAGVNFDLRSEGLSFAAELSKLLVILDYQDALRHASRL